MEMWKGMYKELSPIVSGSNKNEYDNFPKQPPPPVFH